MKNSKTKTKTKQTIYLTTLKYTARILSTITLIFITIFILGHIFFPDAESSITFTESIGFLFFPIGFSIGLIIAYKNELLGGIITLISFIFFVIFIYILRGIFIIAMDHLFFTILNIPGILYIIVGILSKTKHKN